MKVIHASEIAEKSMTKPNTKNRIPEKRLSHLSLMDFCTMCPTAMAKKTFRTKAIEPPAITLLGI